MVAIDTEHPEDERHPALQWATRLLVSLYPELRLMCVSVVRAAPVGEGPDTLNTTTGRHLEHKMRLRHWIEPLAFSQARISLHVVEGANAGSAGSVPAGACLVVFCRLKRHGKRRLQRPRRARSGAPGGAWDSVDIRNSCSSRSIGNLSLPGIFKLRLSRIRRPGPPDLHGDLVRTRAAHCEIISVAA